MNKLYDGEPAWAYVFGSSWETWPWWRAVEYVEGAWDVPGVARVTMADPDADEDDFIEGPTKTFEITPVILQAAIVAVLGENFEEDDITSLDAVSGDAILQVACLGEVVYG